jgi:predicted DNA-binding transcriptional regulator AlpA
MPNPDHSKADILAIIRTIEDHLAGLQKLVAQCSVMIGRMESVAAPVAAIPIKTTPALKLLNTRDVAELLGIKEQTVRSWRTEQMKGPPWITLDGGRVRYDEADVLNYIASSKKYPGPVKLQ